MNAPERHLDWVDANQRVLVAEFERLKLRLAGENDVVARAEIDAARAALPQPAAIDRLAATFALSAFERDIVLLCAGVEMDAALAALCGEAQGQPQWPWATFGLATAMLGNAHWSALAPPRPLRRWRLVEVDTARGLATARLAIDERIVHFLAGLDYVDPRVEALLRPLGPPTAIGAGHAAMCDAIVNRLSTEVTPLSIVQLSGADRDGREDIAAASAARLGLCLHAIDATALPAAQVELAALGTLCAREAALAGSALLIDCGSEPPSTQSVQFVERLHGVVFLAASRAANLRRPSLHCEVGFPNRAEQRRLWEQALGAAAPAHADELAAVATQFRLSARGIVAAGAAIDDKRGGQAPLWRTCQRAAPAGLTELAQRIEPAAGWDDLVLPAAQKQVLAQIAVHMRHRFAVYEDWGFAGKGNRGLGISALFAGESGTGKTMAAEVLARELRLELFRVDLSSVISKYIGETEKNLRVVFDAAEGTGAMLLFDEADALFGKRSEVKDSHDRYANIEVSYLLQRMEAYSGLAVLTTNHKAALDAAFQRRLRFVVQFPFPDLAQREGIWRVAFPPAAPLQAIDYAKLARLNVAGGTVRNIALSAAFLAAEARVPIGMAQLFRAAHLDAAKSDKPCSESETRGWV